MAAIRRENGQAITREPNTGLQSETGVRCRQRRDDDLTIGRAIRRPSEPDHPVESAASERAIRGVWVRVIALGRHNLFVRDSFPKDANFSTVEYTDISPAGSLLNRAAC